MSQIQLCNGDVKAKINTRTGMQSLIVEGQEKLYQGGVWPEPGKYPGIVTFPDPILFPITGPLKKAKHVLPAADFDGQLYRGQFKPNDPVYLLNGRAYSMPQHGFVRNHELTLLDVTKESCTLQLRANNQTQKMYPLKFVYQLTYQLTEDGFIKTQLVKNKDENPLLFSVGDHTALSVDEPMDSYELVFDQTDPMYLIHPTLGELPIFEGRLCLSEDLIQDRLTLKFKDFNATTCQLYKNGILEMVYDVRAANMYMWTADRNQFLCIEPWEGEEYALNNIHEAIKNGTLKQLNPGEKPYSLSRRMSFPH